MYYICLLSLFADGSLSVASDELQIIISRAKQSASSIQISMYTIGNAGLNCQIV
jgi:hypothetical protein